MLLTIRAEDVADAVSVAVAAAGGADRLSPTALGFLTVMVDALPGGYATAELLDRPALFKRPGGARAMEVEARRAALRTAVLLVVLSEEPSAADYARLTYWMQELGVDEPSVEVVGAIAAGAVAPDLLPTPDFDASRTPAPLDRIGVYIGATATPLGEIESCAFATGCSSHPLAFNTLLGALLTLEYGMSEATAGEVAMSAERRPLDRERSRAITRHPEGGRAIADALLRGADADAEAVPVRPRRSAR